jgi:2-keto-4-pentenoate hydratase/2-oxohepta-3-ene-1,7-dioic acid hydratase in catechol pathway
MNSIKIHNKNITPSKVVCIGRNYVDHIKELNNETPTEPVIFMKPNSSISNEIHFNEIEEVHYEGEICFSIKDGQIDAVGFGLDLTKREVQSKLKAKGLPWERAKAFDGSAVLSNFVSIDGSVDELYLELYINDELTQKGGVELMLYKPDEIIKEIQSFCTLEDGDVIMTGTPKGVGKIPKGAHFHGKILNMDELLLDSIWVVK